MKSRPLSVIWAEIPTSLPFVCEDFLWRLLSQIVAEWGISEAVLPSLSTVHVVAPLDWFHIGAWSAMISTSGQKACVTEVVGALADLLKYLAKSRNLTLSSDFVFLIGRMESLDITARPSKSQLLSYHAIRHRREMWTLQEELYHYRTREQEIIQREKRIAAFCEVYELTLTQIDQFPAGAQNATLFRDYYGLTPPEVTHSEVEPQSKDHLKSCICRTPPHDTLLDISGIPPETPIKGLAETTPTELPPDPSSQWVQQHMADLQSLQNINQEYARYHQPRTPEQWTTRKNLSTVHPPQRPLALQRDLSCVLDNSIATDEEGQTLAQLRDKIKLGKNCN